MKFKIEYEKEDDGRWIAEIEDIPGALVYGSSPDDAGAKVISLALKAIADKLEFNEADCFS